MKRFIPILLTLLALAACKKAPVGGDEWSKNDFDGIGVKPVPPSWDGEKRGNIKYQILIYSFADSNGDGIGDFRGIEDHLDYFESLGVNGLWLSPAHPSDSYHGYDIRDYYALCPDFGTEADFESLIKAAKAKGIDIYMDYVLNHSGKGNPWFKSAVKDESSKYRDYYCISKDYKTDVSAGKFAGVTSADNTNWFSVSTMSPAVLVQKTDEAVTSGTLTWNLWCWPEGKEGSQVKLSEAADGSLYAVIDCSGKTGFLVRRYAGWDAGSKFGAGSVTSVTLGTQISLEPDGCDMYIESAGRYKITVTGTQDKANVWYLGAFGSWMPDLYYGPAATCETSDCFKDLAGSADKWIKMGVSGQRLDAVMHIYGGMNAHDNASNITFLKKWYDHCNATYKSVGGEGDFYMVGESWESVSNNAQYSRSGSSFFEFDFWARLNWAVNAHTGKYFAKDIIGYRDAYNAVDQSYVPAILLTNHDQDRAASILGKDPGKLRLAASLLLTSSGTPYIYQGEELGYWGKKATGDENVRTPMNWTKGGVLASKYLPGKVDTEMLSSGLSVQEEGADAGSLLNVYRTLAALRNSCPALAEGKMVKHPVYNENSTGADAIGAWYMVSGSQKLLVIHNFGAVGNTLTLDSDDLSRPLCVVGLAETKGDVLYLDPYSSVIFEQ